MTYKSDLVITDKTTVDNFTESQKNKKKVDEINTYVMNNYNYELSFNQIANGINLFLIGIKQK